jgi:hypothetical protein
VRLLRAAETATSIALLGGTFWPRGSRTETDASDDPPRYPAPHDLNSPPEPRW